MRIFKNFLKGGWILIGIFVFVSGCTGQKRADIHKKKVGDIEMAYYTRGSGPPLVMIMGFRGTLAGWDPGLLTELEKHYTLILFDNRGVGLSSDTTEDLTTISQMSEDTALLIKALGFDSAYVLGWSMGARIAQQLATDHPDLVDRLILCSPNPGGTFQAPRLSDDYKELLSVDLPLEKALSLIFPHTTEGFLASTAFVMRLTEGMVEGTIPDDLTVNAETITRQRKALILWNDSNQNYEALATIKVPTLVVGGLEDALDEPENVRIVANKIPFAWAAYFQGAGHAFLSQDYKQFAQLVVLFIESDKKVKK